jgi:hypothetical protein
MKNYRNTVKSLDSVKNKLDALERNINGHSNNNNNDYSNFDYTRRLFPEIRMPTMDFVGILFMEHPYFGPHEIGNILRHRLEMRHYFPGKFKSAALARGDIYYPDETEEYRQDMLDAVEKEKLKRQRARRERVGTITSTHWDRENGKFHFEVVMPVEEGHEEDQFSSEDYFALLSKEKDV